MLGISTFFSAKVFLFTNYAIKEMVKLMLMIK